MGEGKSTRAPKRVARGEVEAGEARAKSDGGWRAAKKEKKKPRVRGRPGGGKEGCKEVAAICCSLELQVGVVGALRSLYACLLCGGEQRSRYLYTSLIVTSRSGGARRQRGEKDKQVCKVVARRKEVMLRSQTSDSNNT